MSNDFLPIFFLFSLPEGYVETVPQCTGRARSINPSQQKHRSTDAAYRLTMDNEEGGRPPEDTKHSQHPFRMTRPPSSSDEEEEEEKKVKKNSKRKLDSTKKIRATIN